MKKSVLSLLLAATAVTTGLAQRIDFNMYGRSVTEGTAPGYRPRPSLGFSLSSCSFLLASRTRLTRMLSLRISSMPDSPIWCRNSMSSVGTQGFFVENDSIPQNIGSTHSPQTAPLPSLRKHCGDVSRQVTRPSSE